MNQAELIAKVAEVSGASKKDVEAILKTTADVVTNQLQEGDAVAFPSLGRFTVKESKEMELIEEKWKKEAGHFLPSSRPEERLLKIHAGVWIGQMRHTAQGGVIESLIRMNENRIEFIKLTTDGDNGTARDWSKLEMSLTGATLESEELSHRLTNYFSHHQEQSCFNIDDWVEALLRIRNEKKRVTGRE